MKDGIRPHGNTLLLASGCYLLATLYLQAQPTGLGLLATYYANPDFTAPKVTRVEPVNFSWGGNAPVYGVGADDFSVRWSGQVVPPFTDLYTFYVSAWSWDGVRLFVDGQLIIDVPPFFPHRGSSVESPIERQGLAWLVSGLPHDIRLEYIELTGNAAATLSWSSSILTKEIIPTGNLVPTTAECPATGLRIPGLFNTGIDRNGVLLAAGAVDPHYQLVQSADAAFPGPSAWVVNEGWPVAPAPGGPWLANGPNSKWIAPDATQTLGNGPGSYTYQTTFDLTGLDPATASIVGQWSVDNGGTDILLNGFSAGQRNTAGFTAWTPFSITKGFKPGMNTLTFVMSNWGNVFNPTGLRVEMCGSVLPRCLNFELFQPMTLPNPWTFLGHTFEVFNFDGSTWPAPGIRTDQLASGLHFTGMDCGYRLEINLARPCSSVELRLVHFAVAGTVTAYNASGAIVSSVKMAAPQAMPEMVTTKGAGITKVVVTAPSDETRLLELCTRAEYPAVPLAPLRVTNENGHIILCWGSLPDKTYCVEYKTSLAGPWQPHPIGCVTANDYLTCVWDSSAGADPIRIYRLLEMP